MSSLGIEQRVKDFLQRHAMPAINLAVMTKQFGHSISETAISQACRRVKDFNSVDTIFLSGLLNKIENLIQAASPLPLNLRTNPVELCELIRDLEAAPADSPTLSDLILLNEIIQGRDLNDAAQSRNVSLADLKQRLYVAATRIQRAALLVAQRLQDESAA